MGSSRLLTLAALLVVMAAGCPFSFTNDDHCAAQDGDATCAAADGSTPYCALDGCGLYDEVDNRTGCVAEPPADMSCYSPCGGKQDASGRSDCSAPDTEATSASPGTESSSSGGTTEDDPSSSSSAGCSCEPDAPICVDGECTTCDSDAFCETNVGDARPYCEAGDCVGCRPQQAGTAAMHLGCSGDTPNCEAGECVAKCLFPDDCPETGCDFREGFCAPMETRFFVASTGGNDAGAGTAAEPLSTIQEALDRIGERGNTSETRVGTILLAPGTYTETVDFGARTVVLRPADPDAAPPVFAIPMPKKGEPVPVFAVRAARGAGGGVLSLVGIRVQASPGPVIFIESTASFFGDDLELVDNAAVVHAGGGAGFLRNSVVTGSGQTPFVFLGPAEFGIESTTIIENDVTELLDCTLGPQSRVTLRHSIAGNLMAGSPMLATGECNWVDGGAIDSSVGLLPSSGSFREESDYRLETLADEVYQASDVEYCEPGVQTAPDGFLIPCAPLRDIDGKSRAEVNWRGFSVR